MSENFVFDETCLTIQGFYTAALSSPANNTPPPSSKTGDQDLDRCVYGNGVMTGICFVKYNYYSPSGTSMDDADAQMIESKIKARIQFCNQSSGADLTSANPPWSVYSADDDGRNDQYYHDYKILVDNTPPVPYIGKGTISGNVAFYLLAPPSNGAYMSTIYAFYQPENSPDWTDSRTPQNPYSTHSICEINFTVTPPAFSTSDFNMVPVFPSSTPDYNDKSQPIIYSLNYLSDLINQSVPHRLVSWDFWTTTSDFGPGKITNVGQSDGGFASEGTGCDPLLSLFSMRGNRVIFALQTRPPTIWSKSYLPPPGYSYTTYGEIYSADNSCVTTCHMDSLDILLNCTFPTDSFQGVAIVNVPGAQIIDMRDSSADYGVTTLLALDSFGTSFSVMLNLDLSGGHAQQALSSVTTKLPV